MHLPGKAGAQSLKTSRKRLPADLVPDKGRGGNSGQHHRIAPSKEILLMKDTGAFFRAQVAGAEQAAEMAPSLAVLGVSENVRRAIVKDQPGAGLKSVAVLPGDRMGAHYTRSAVAIGDTQPRKAHRLGRPDHFLRARCPLEEGEIRPGADLEKDGIG